jgi:hypothetical protein
MLKLGVGDRVTSVKLQQQQQRQIPGVCIQNGTFCKFRNQNNSLKLFGQRFVEKTLSNRNFDQSVACFLQGNVPGQGM